MENPEPTVEIFEASGELKQAKLPKKPRPILILKQIYSAALNQRPYTRKEGPFLKRNVTYFSLYCSEIS